MATLMRDWISPAVKRHLETTKENRGTSDGQSLRQEADGALVIHNIQGKSVQILEFIPNSPRYTAWVSDSYTRIRAVFSKTSTEEFQKVHQRPFSDRTLGAVLGINDFSLTFNPTAPKSQRVMLEIDRFVLQGSEGSGNFGNPVVAETAAGIRELLDQLLATDDSSITCRSNGSRMLVSPIHPHSAHSMDEDSTSTQSTQAGFSTQAPRIMPKRISGGGQIESASSRRHLLALLGPQHPNTVTTANCEGKVSTLDQATLLVKQLFPKSGTGGDTSERQIHASKNVTVGSLSEQSPVDVEKENSPRVQGQSEQLPNVKGRILQSVNSQNQQREEKEDGQSPWEGLSRIPRKYVQISRDQRVLLERDDCWYSYACRIGATSVNVPSNVLLDLQTFHDRSPSPEITFNHTDGSEGEETGSEDEGDPELPGTPGMHMQKIIVTGPDVPAIRHSSIPASPDDDAESTSDGPFSWSTSPIAQQMTSAQSDSQGRETQITATAPIVFQPLSQRTPSPTNRSCDISAVVSDPFNVRREPDSEESDSERPISQIPISNQEAFPVRSSGGLVKSPTKSVKRSSPSPSSSPIEMETSIPYGLDDQTRRSLDSINTSTLAAMQSVSALVEKPQPTLQVERTPFAIPGKRSPDRKPLPRPRSTKLDSREIPGEDEASDLSDSIIPGTFDNESGNPGQISENTVPLRESNNFSNYMIDRDHVISPSPMSPTSFVQLQVLASSLPDAEGGLPNSQISIEAESLLQSTCRSECSSPHRDLHSTDTVSVLRERIRESTNNGAPGLLLSTHIQKPKEAMQVSFESCISFTDHPMSDHIIFSSPIRPPKRQISHLLDVSAPFQKRRRSLQATIFENGPDKKATMDPGEIANTNRRNFFLQELSLIDNLRSPLAESELASRAVREESPEVNSKPARNEDRDLEEPLVESELSKQEISSLVPLTAPSEENEKSSVSELVDNEHAMEITKTNETNGREGASESVWPIQNEPSNVFGTESLTLQPSRINTTATAITDLPIEQISETPLPALYEIFKANYLAHDVSERSFNKACVYLEWLQSKKMAPHPVLWDDFIRAFSSEFIKYVRKSLLLKEPAMTAIDFYNTHILKPVFNDRVVTSNRMANYFLLNPEETTKNRELFFSKQRSDISHDLISANLSPLMDSPKSKVSQAERLKIIRKPFFETASQIYTRDLSTSAELQEITSGQLNLNEDMENTFPSFLDDSSSRNITPLSGEMTETNERRLPRMSSMPRMSPSRRSRERIRDIEDAIAVGHEVRDIGPHGTSFATDREESPILGCRVPQSSLSARNKIQSMPVSPASNGVGFRQDSAFKSPVMPALKIPCGKATRLPGLNTAETRRHETERREVGHESFKSEMIQSQATSELVTFKDFARAYVPRRQRVASISSSTSLPKHGLSDRKGERGVLALHQNL